MDTNNRNRSKPPVPEVSLMMQRQQEAYQAAMRHSEKLKMEATPPAPEPAAPEPAAPEPVEPEMSPPPPEDAKKEKEEKQP